MMNSDCPEMRSLRPGATSTRSVKVESMRVPSCSMEILTEARRHVVLEVLNPCDIDGESKQSGAGRFFHSHQGDAEAGL